MTKKQCPKCKSYKTKYLDKTLRQSVFGTEHYEKVYKCLNCGEIFNLPIEVPYGYGTRKAKRQ